MNLRRTEQTKQILSRGTPLELLPFLLDQFRSDLVRIRPVRSEVHHPWTFVPLKYPGSETGRGPLKRFHHKELSLRKPAKRSKTIQDNRQ